MDYLIRGIRQSGAKNKKGVFTGNAGLGPMHETEGGPSTNRQMQTRTTLNEMNQTYSEMYRTTRGTNTFDTKRHTGGFSRGDTRRMNRTFSRNLNTSTMGDTLDLANRTTTNDGFRAATHSRNKRKNRNRSKDSRVTRRKKRRSTLKAIDVDLGF